ncbi:MAG TPA: response regulator transcription factor [Brumimicrobium sp.]|nr:response regulator transcription factor [Brumimicrobium sp.]
MKNNNPHILIVDDHQMLLEGIRSFVAGQFPKAVLLLASTHQEILSVLNKRSIDVLLLDLMLGNEDSRTFLSQLLQLQPEMKIVVISSMEEESIVNALLQNGAHGFVGKSSSTMYIAEAINAVMNGNIYIDPLLKDHVKKKNESLNTTGIVLTLREKEVLNETLKEKRIKDIAASLFVSEKTVENHRSNLFTKFDVSNVTGLVKKALLLGYIPDNID